MHHNYMEIFLVLVFVIGVAKLAGVLSQRLGQPAVLGEIAAGLILGPTLLAIAYWPIFPESSHEKAEITIVHDAVQGIAEDEEDVREGLVTLGEEIRGTILSSEALSEISEEERKTIADDTAKHLELNIHERKTFMEDIIKVLAELGVLFLMFLAGLETNLKQMMKVGKVALFTAIGGVVAPMGLGLLVTVLLIPATGFYTALFVGTILCATSVSISAQTLKELGRLRSKEGTTILGAAVIDDVVGIIVLSLVIAFNPIKLAGYGAHEKLYETWQRWLTAQFGMAETASQVLGVVLLILAIVLFFYLFFMFGLKFFQRVMEFLSKLPTSQGVIAFALAIALFYAWSAEYIGAVAAITGTFLAGLLFAQTTFHREIEQKLSVITYSFFVPIFFINIGLEANARTLGGDLLVFTIVLCIVAVAAKVVGCYAGAKMGGFTMQESLRVGMGMVSRGEVGLIVASVGLSAGIIGRDIFSSMIIMVLVTTLVTPILLKMVFKGSTEPEPLDV